MGRQEDAVVRQKILEVEKQLRELPHHKGTDHYIGRLRAKLAILNDRLDSSSAVGGGGGGGYAVKKQGDATVVLIGPPSAGKSTLINKLTNTESKVAPYSFTTVSVIPGMMKYRNAYIQILDVPGLIEGAHQGKGRGREVLSVARNSDLIVFMSDPKRLDFFGKLVGELESVGIRINKIRPNIDIIKKDRGGIDVRTNIGQPFDKAYVREVAEEYGLKNAEIVLKERVTPDQLIDSFSKNRVYIPALYVVNKCDTLPPDEDEKLDSRIIRISAQNEINLGELRERIWDKLGFVTVYLNDEACVVKKGLTLREVGEKIGSSFLEDKSMAKIWGPGAKFAGQEVSLGTKVRDGMRIKFI